MEYFFIILLFTSPFLLLATYVMTAKSKSFWRIFTAHTITFVVYITFVFFYSKMVTGHDEYGLGKIGLALMFIIGHVVVGFLHGLIIKSRTRQSE